MQILILGLKYMYQTKPCQQWQFKFMAQQYKKSDADAIEKHNFFFIIYSTCIYLETFALPHD